MELTPEQSDAKDAMLKWFAAFHNGDASQQIFRIFGYAGTGKTTVIKDIIGDLYMPNDELAVVQFGAYTGKAALVMAKNGLPARTLHSLIYIPVVPDKEECGQLKAQMAKAHSDGDKERKEALSEQLRDASKLSFTQNDESVLLGADLLVLDECSMVNDDMLNDILAFGVPLLVLGDPGQLPPISGTGALVRDKPDVLFTKIHRQALDNPIINLSMRAREGLNIPIGDYGTSRHALAGSVSIGEFKHFDQILVGKNKTRRLINTRMRKIFGLGSPDAADKGIYPVVGDKLICLRNKRDMGLFNGLMCTVRKVLDEYDTTIEMVLAPETGGEVIVKALRAHFDEYETPGTIESLQWWDFQEGEEFDYGYAITVHKSQGSQWDHVGFYDDKMLIWDKIARRRWFYTGITRAAETITIMS